MKHKISKRVMVALAMCVACVLGFGVTFAQADENGNLNSSDANSLTVGVNMSESDLGGAPIHVDVYCVATASKDTTYDTYNYEFVSEFEGLAEDYNALATITDPTKHVSAEQWQTVAEKAKQMADDNGVDPIGSADAANEKISGLDDGIYLVVVRNTQSTTHSFTFSPTLVALPGRVGDNGPVYTTWEGTGWSNDVEIVAKGGMSLRKGGLKINKTVSGFSGEAATFVFHIVDTETGGQKYENYAAVQYTAEGVQSATVNNIPAGMELTVTEVDSGARYQVVSEASTTTTIVGDTTVEVNFENEPNGSAHGGHGIENHFVFDEKLNGGDWKLEVRAIDASEVVKNS